MTSVSTTDLLRVRAALAVGVPPSHALRAATGAALADVGRQVALGRGLADAARASTQAPGPLGAGPLLRALALAERCGHGAVDAVDVALGTRQDAVADDQRLRARSAQATGTARLLAVLPVVAWALLVALDPSALRFYAAPPGWVCATATVVLTVAARWWSRRLVARAERAAALADPLAVAPTGFDRMRAAVAAGPAFVTAVLVAGPVAGLAVGAAIAALSGRPRTAGTPSPLGAVEMVELLRMLLGVGIALPAALDDLAAVVQAPVDARLRAVARRLRAGEDVEPSFDASGLAEIGAVLAISERWGVAAGEPLRRLGETFRARQRAAAETAAERVQLALVFPTTLLTLPAFVIAIVPPLVWAALSP
ncbi:MAG TPA: type II secretion system F family protein [Euzebyales bacterium]